MSPPRPNEAATYQWWPLDLKNAAQERAEELGLSLSEATRRLWSAYLAERNLHDAMTAPKAPRGGQ
jgi:hypothetical protein